jgi:hypothetical protein
VEEEMESKLSATLDIDANVVVAISFVAFLGKLPSRRYDRSLILHCFRCTCASSTGASALNASRVC